MMQPIEFRGTSSGGEHLPLIVGWGMGAVPIAIQIFAAVTGQWQKMAGPDPAPWTTLLAMDLGMLAGFGGAGTLLYLLSAHRRKKDAATLRIRLDRDGLDLAYQGRSHRMSWGDTRVEYLPGDEETDSQLLFHSPTGTFSYPWLLRQVDHTDFIAILRVKLPRLPLGDSYYSPEIHGMVIGLEDILRRNEPKQFPYAEKLCHEIIAKAETMSQLQYGMMPVLYTCQRAFEQMGRQDEAGRMGFRIQTLLAQLQ